MSQLPKQTTIKNKMQYKSYIQSHTKMARTYEKQRPMWLSKSCSFQGKDKIQLKIHIHTHTHTYEICIDKALSCLCFIARACSQKSFRNISTDHKLSDPEKLLNGVIADPRILSTKNIIQSKKEMSCHLIPIQEHFPYHQLHLYISQKYLPWTNLK